MLRVTVWVQAKDADPVGLEMFRRHYSYRKRRDQLWFDFFPEKNRNSKHFVGPGAKMVLLTDTALFVWRKFISMDKQEGVNCAVFRNEGSVRASDLILAAMDLAYDRWPAERLYTYVNAKRVKSRNPGYCFLMAGWRKCGLTKSGLLILESVWGENPIYEKYRMGIESPNIPQTCGRGLPLKDSKDSTK